MSDKVQFDLGGEYENPSYKSCFARSIEVNSHGKEPKSLDYKQLKSENKDEGGHLKKQLAPSRPFTPDFQGSDIVRLRKNTRSGLDETRRYSCGNINNTRRTSLCLDRRTNLPVENISSQSKIETLEWQIKEVQKSRDMYRAVMKQVVTYLEKTHHSLELLGSRMSRRHSVHRSKSEHQLEHSRGSIDISLQQTVNRTLDEHQLKDIQWQQSKAEEPTPEEIPPDKLAKEAFRLLRTAQSLLNTKEPDLAQNDHPENDIEFLAQLAREFPPPEHKPQRTTSFSLSPKLIQPETEMKISTAFNRKLSLQLCDSRRNTRIFRNVDSARGSVAESDTELVNDNGMFFNPKSKSEKSNSPANGSISSVEDESGFSSMNSFQEVGLPLINSTMTEEVSTKSALLRSMLHNNSDYSSLSITLNRDSMMETISPSESCDRQEEKRTVDNVKLWQKPSSLPPSTPQHKRWFSSPVEEPASQSMKVLWV
ncbi:uncharacterized protein [Leptinotarsa decemlineata]|uniref:uncharacterized protein n=1 Tax=Leptinotarsa decemlineata TaxID=7539 RepID=UPI003D30797A